MITSIRETISAARANKKHPTVDGYAKIFASLDLLEALLDSRDQIATTLDSFTADLIAELVAATTRSPATSYASAVSSMTPPAITPRTATPAIKQTELTICLEKASDLLALPVPEIKAKVEEAVAATGVDKLKDVKLKGIKVLSRDRLLIAVESEKTATLLCFAVTGDSLRRQDVVVGGSSLA